VRIRFGAVCADFIREFLTEPKNWNIAHLNFARHFPFAHR
jgi:hypothetical protein